MQFKSPVQKKLSASRPVPSYLGLGAVVSCVHPPGSQAPQHPGNFDLCLSTFFSLVSALPALRNFCMLKSSALIPFSLLKLLMEIYNLHSSLTTSFCCGLLPGSIKSSPDGLKMCFLLSLVVICLFIIRKDKFWLQEVLLAVNNAIKSKSEVPALHRADLCGATGSALHSGSCLLLTWWSGHGDRFLAEHAQVLSYNCSSLVSWDFAQICVPCSHPH